MTYFKVENFKRFDSLELTDIGQFNLIVGDNNVGKTSVLEALLFESDRVRCLGKLHKTLILKGIRLFPKRIFSSKGDVLNVEYPSESFLTYLSNNSAKEIKFLSYQDHGEEVSFDWVDLGLIEFEPRDIVENTDRFDIAHTHFLGNSSDNRYIKFEHGWGFVENGKKIGQDYSTYIGGLYLHYLDQDPSGIPLPFISVSLESNESLSKSYFGYVSLSRQAKKQLIEDIRFIIPKIEDFEVRKLGGEDQLLVGLKNQDEMMPLSTFGESVTRVLHVLLEISKNQGKRLMIDEIDTGIHYSRMKNFLKTVFQVARKNDVQLFMTTHSLECQQTFAEVFEDTDMVEYQSRVRQYSLLEKPDGQVVANVHNFEQLQYALEIGFETRGGKKGW